ncbi:YicC/YloC family endoribonuclease [Clostridium rectalis]|uniref:YicC/YloC family endoribonuclease n=1 Tax=Clostridium rectalis TaxID=2040295 RepID=UPI000F63A8AE|nr:YicC/YloC family endoribonuclease [Clostridium rectalis]
MIKSMTGFGRATAEDSSRNFIVEIKSVNHRYCDINVKMPKSLISLEDKIRNLIQKEVNRGKIDVFITLNTHDKKDVRTVLNKTLADSYFECLTEIKNDYDVKNDITVSLIARFPEVVTLEQQEEDMDNLWISLSKPLMEALSFLIEMRKKEGLKLQENILSKCKYIKFVVDKIEKKAPNVPIAYKDKLTNRLKELLGEAQVDENKIAMEVAVFADRSCIDEEIVRLNSHLIQMRETLELNEPVGRKLDFIVQEMNREANTIASKANNLEISNLVINIKNEIEKIREQIQNVE